MARSIFFEPQHNGLCKKHALNAYFGFSKISSNEFYDYQIEYDAIYIKKFNISSKCHDYDTISSDQKNVIGHILKKYNVYTRYYAINQLFKKNIYTILNILRGDFFFIFTSSHIYGARIKDNIWYTVDSIYGVTSMNIDNLLNNNMIGFIIPVYSNAEFYYNISLIKDIFNYTDDIQDIRDYLIEIHKDNLVLGALEIPLNICIDIMEFKFQLNSKHGEFKSLYDDVVNYNSFLCKFTNGQYNNISLILQYIPNIILRLLLMHEFN